MAVASWKSRLLHVAGLLEDPGVKEVMITASGAVLAVRATGGKRVGPDFSPAERRALLRALLGAMAVPFGPEQPDVAHELDQFRVRVLGPPLVEDGPVVRIERVPTLAASLSALVATEVLTEPMAELLRRGIGQGSLLLVGARGTGKSALLAALTREAVAKRRVLVSGLSARRFDRGLAAEMTFTADGPLHEVSVALGAELIVVDQPSGARWLQLLAGPRPFIATAEAPDSTSAIARLVSTLVLERPGLSADGAESMLEGGVALIAELGQRPGELAPQLLALAELRRIQGRLTLRVLARRKPEGGEELSLDGSRLRERLAGFNGRVSQPPRPSFIREETKAPPPARHELQEDSGLAVVEAGFAVENEIGADSPVGMIEGRDLSMLRPEQLVSQSFLVDVSKEPAFNLGTHVKTWSVDGADNTGDLEPVRTERASTELSPRAPSDLEPLPEIGEGSFSDADMTMGEDQTAERDVDSLDEFGGVETLPPSVLPGQAPVLPPLPEALKSARVGQDGGRTLILGAGSATPSPEPEDVVDRRGGPATVDLGPKSRG